MQLRKAERRQIRIKMGLQGPSGSGKTTSALLIAYGLCRDYAKVAIIDTEARAADLYAHLGPYNVLPLDAPFTPERYVQAIHLCVEAGMEVVILDSISHEWEFILETHGATTGNSYTNWARFTPRHNAFIQAMLQSPCHLIATIRAKQDYILSEKNGKQVPEKVGLKGVTREGMDYEFTLLFELDVRHQARATKDRTGLFSGQPEFIPVPETGRQILDWCKLGTSREQVEQLIQQTNDIPALVGLYHQYPEFRQPLESLFIQRKEQINANQFTNQSNQQVYANPHASLTNQ
ncbi:AAA family ATPase [Spirosoma areae]